MTVPKIGSYEEAAASFTHQLADYFATLAPDALHPFRKKAWEAFSKRGLPLRLEAGFRHLKGVALANLKLQRPSDSIASFIIRGADSCEMLPLKKGYDLYHALLSARFEALLKDPDPFVLLNGALFQDGAFLYVPPKTVLEDPIVIDSQESLLAFSRLHISLGRGAEVSLILNFPKLPEGALFSTLTDITLAEEARLKLFSTSTASSDGWHFDHIRTTLKRNSFFESVLVDNGALCHRTDYHVQLLGEGSSCDLSGLLMAKKNRSTHVNVLMELVAPHCRTMQLFKGALLDSAESSFEGKILVHKTAQKTESYQLNANLLLSEKAKAFSEPNLEISADDVKASHGSTFGQVSEDSLFYLQSRGFSKKEASSLLTRAFFEEVLSKELPSLVRLKAKEAIQEFVGTIS